MLFEDIDIVIDNYDAILVSGGCSDASVLAVALNIDNIVGRVVVRNFSDSSISITVMLQVLYKKR